MTKLQECLLAIYLFGNLVPVLFQVIEYSEELDEPYYCIGCVIETYNKLKDQLNEVGLWIVIVAVLLLTLPAIVICFIVWVIMKCSCLLWCLFKKIFAKKQK